MNQEPAKIKSFINLDAWKEGHKLVMMIYEITKEFPREEVFGLVLQLRRCSVSITSNIAEGFAKASYKEKVKFYYIAQGSLMELQNQILVARDIGYITNDKFKKIAEQSVKVSKIINGLIKKSKDFYS